MAPTSQNSMEPSAKKMKVEDVTAERQYRIRGLRLSCDHERAKQRKRTLHSLHRTNQSLTKLPLILHLLPSTKYDAYLR
ncbi:hypothetical protein HN011_002111 [Eciton burchellii]|nr:hypothetical protein HN011_002111 [Eciton burchellii]